MAAFLDLWSLLLSVGRSTTPLAQDTLQRAQARPGPASGERHTQVVVLESPPEPSALAGQVKALLQQVAPDVQPRQLYDQLGAFSVDLSESQAERLRSLPSIRSVEADRPVPLMPPVTVTPGPQVEGDDASLELAARRVLWSGKFRNGFAANAAYSVEDQGLQLAATYGDSTSASGDTLPWGVRAVWNGLDVGSKGNIGVGSTVFVIDSGVSNTTGDLNLNTTWSRSWIAGETPFTDGNGHGTHVAGTIAALANGVGVVGVAPGAQVVSLKVFDSTGAGASYTSIIDAINYAVGVINSNGLDKSKVAINMSLGGGLSSSLTNAVYNAANQGIRFSIAAGNSGQDVDGFSPANAGDHPNVYTVSAVDSAYKMASWSNWDRVDSRDTVDNVDLAAPGVGVLSYYQGQLAYLSGTSMAAPHVAGLLLAGGVSPGALVTPSVAGTADPFALAASTAPAPPPPPTYTLEGPTSLDEGGSLQINVITTNVSAGTVLTLQFSGTGISSADLASGGLTAQVTVGSDGKGSFSTTVVADNSTEGNETLQVALFSDSTLATRLASASVILQDTSTTPPPPPSDPNADQVLWGTAGSDTITGGSGNDRLTGVLARGTTATAMGTNQVDVLTGGAGADVFVLGDRRGIFYDDRSSGSLGSADYASIMDFNPGVDKVQLVSASYLTTTSSGSTSLYWDRNYDGILNTSGRNRDELIAVFNNASLSGADVIWV